MALKWRQIWLTWFWVTQANLQEACMCTWEALSWAFLPSQPQHSLRQQICSVSTLCSRVCQAAQVSHRQYTCWKTNMIIIAIYCEQYNNNVYLKTWCLYKLSTILTNIICPVIEDWNLDACYLITNFIFKICIFIEYAEYTQHNHMDHVISTCTICIMQWETRW